MGDSLNRRGGGGSSSILLVERPRFTACRNDTTATAESQGGNTIAVSFWVAQPPQLSLFSIHCTDRHGKHRLFSILPRVVGAHGPFVLLRASFGGSREFFLYRAGTPPSLESVPSPFPGDDFRVREFGILDGHGGGHYLLAALRDAPDDDDDGAYQLRIYSSDTRSWSTRTLRNPCPGVDRVVPDKVITLGGQDQGLLAWVDLSHGLLVCNIPILLLQHHEHQDLPPAGAVSFIPLPEPLPGNMYKLKHPIPPTKKVKNHPCADQERRSASWFRDLTCVDGAVLKFVEMENHPSPPPDDDNIVYDSDLITSLKRKAVDGDPKLQLSAFRDAWRAVTWTRKLASESFWRQTCAAHVADIKQGQQLALTEHYSSFPILSPDDDDDVLYLRSLPEPSERDGSVVALDIGNKSLKATAHYYLAEDCFHHPARKSDHPFRACTLSRHLDMTNPGIQVSECRKVTEAGSSARETPTPSKPRATFQSPSELAAKLKRARTPLERIVQKNPRISQIHPSENNLPQQHKWDTMTPGHSSWPHQNNLPQQHTWDAATPGHSSWPHQKNLPPRQFFNTPYGRGYASLAPRPNYQPPWSPSKHQLTSGSEFGPHEAPQPCFNNNYYGASYHGYSQQLYAPDSFAYGAHTRYRQQAAPSMELSTGSSWQPPPPGV